MANARWDGGRGVRAGRCTAIRYAPVTAPRALMHMGGASRCGRIAAPREPVHVKVMPSKHLRTDRGGAHG